MTEVDTGQPTLPTTAGGAALQAMVAARNRVVVAKRSRAPELIECAQRDLQSAVDRARDQGLEWGQIGSTLGIARGNAYQRFRKRNSHNGFSADAARVRFA